MSKMKKSILSEIKRILLDKCCIDEARINPDARFIEDLNLDFMPIFDLMIVLSEKYSIKIIPEDIDKMATVEDAVSLVEILINKD